MSTSFLRSSGSAFWVLIILAIGCGTSAPTGEWVTATGTSAGGFSVQLPVANDEQEGSVVLHGDSVRTHIAICNDSGITYVAGYMDLPASLDTATASERAGAVWGMLAERLGVLPTSEPPPLGAPDTLSQSAWYVDHKGVRLAVAVHLRGERAVLLNAAMPDTFFTDKERVRMLRFLRSVSFTD
ncbi:MAG: hypothetical protein IPK99_15660 [Flavobacteriales bacterium]|nr:hypothetical protein [Flavobacteriales bacterium]